MPRNIEKHLPYFDGYEISREDKIAMVEALYAIAETFADLAFGLHTSQQGVDDPRAVWDRLVDILEDEPVKIE